MAEQEQKGSNAAKAGIAFGGMACMGIPLCVVGAAPIIIIFGGLGILLMPLIILILIFGGGGGSSQQESTGQEIADIAQGNGKGTLAESQVPEDLYDTLEEAGRKCSGISGIILASQIRVDSFWVRDKQGEGTKLGISQLPKDIFDKYGEDKDDNDKTQQQDAEDSIMAQGKHLCALYNDAKALKASGQVPDSEDTLDLALGAYHVGMDSIKASGGISKNVDAQQYAVEVRSNFAMMQGIGAPPTSFNPADAISKEPKPSGTN
jgi:hypothetical protein